MVNDMLMFARGDVGELVRVSADEIVEQVADGLWTRACFMRSARMLRLPPGRTLCSSTRISWWARLVNLIANGVQSGAEHVALTARSSNEGYLEIAVADDGPGVSDEIAPRIFEPFFTTRSGGTGLGLAVVRTVAESFGGSIQLERNASGGATFRLRLPLEAGLENRALQAAAGGG